MRPVYKTVPLFSILFSVLFCPKGGRGRGGGIRKSSHPGYYPFRTYIISIYEPIVPNCPFYGVLYVVGGGGGGGGWANRGGEGKNFYVVWVMVY